MHIAYYITAHGYGHAVRSAAVVRELSPEITITFCTAVPRAFFDEELSRPFGYRSAAFDCGCIQRDSVTVAIPETLETYRRLADRHPDDLARETQWCRENEVSAVVFDIVPLAAEIAHALGVPSIGISNFSWYDIYAPYTTHHKWFAPYLERMAYQYQLADYLLALHPTQSLPHFRHCRPMPIVGRRGTPRRIDIERAYGPSPDKRLALIYVGDFGMDSLPWEQLAAFENWEFLGLHPLRGASANYHPINKRIIPYQDLCASADLVISKIGYGTYAESILNGVPLMYLPREDFAEFPILEHAALQWGHAHRIDHRHFRTLEWGQHLKSIVSTPKPHPIETGGAAACAAAIESILR